jgi:hypothetical protein
MSIFKKIKQTKAFSQHSEHLKIGFFSLIIILFFVVQGVEHSNSGVVLPSLASCTLHYLLDKGC